MPDVANNPEERPNIFSACWARGVETVPPYEAASKDPHAVAYRVTRDSGRDTYELHCDGSQGNFYINASEDAKLKKAADKTIEIRRETHTQEEAVATISGINRKKINLTQKDPTIKLSSSHGEVSLSLYRGGYCGFRHPREDIEYYWQLRYYPKKTGENSSKAAKFKDAVLRKAIVGELSTMAGMYVPRQSFSSANSSFIDLARNQTESDASDDDLGRFLLRSDLDDFDRDLTLISFVAVLLRVIEAEVS